MYVFVCICMYTHTHKYYIYKFSSCKDFINYSGRHRSQKKTQLLGPERLSFVLAVLISS